MPYVADRPNDDAAPDVRGVTEALLRIAASAEALGSPGGLATARAAWMDAARLNGLVFSTAPEAAGGSGEAAAALDGAARRLRIAELEARRDGIELG